MPQVESAVQQLSMQHSDLQSFIQSFIETACSSTLVHAHQASFYILHREQHFCTRYAVNGEGSLELAKSFRFTEGAVVTEVKQCGKAVCKKYTTDKCNLMRTGSTESAGLFDPFSLDAPSDLQVDSLLFVPLLDSGQMESSGAVLGILGVTNKVVDDPDAVSHGFSKRDQELLSRIALDLGSHFTALLQLHQQQTQQLSRTALYAGYLQLAANTDNVEALHAKLMSTMASALPVDDRLNVRGQAVYWMHPLLCCCLCGLCCCCGLWVDDAGSVSPVAIAVVASAFISVMLPRCSTCVTAASSHCTSRQPPSH